MALISLLLFCGLAWHALHTHDEEQDSVQQNNMRVATAVASHMNQTYSGNLRLEERLRRPEMTEYATCITNMIPQGMSIYLIEVQSSAAISYALTRSALLTPHLEKLPGNIAEQLRANPHDEYLGSIQLIDSSNQDIPGLIACTAGTSQTPNLHICATSDIRLLTGWWYEHLSLAGLVSLLIFLGGSALLSGQYRNHFRQLTILRKQLSDMAQRNETCCANATRFRNLFELSEGAIAITRDYRVLLSNDAFSNLFGTTKEPFLINSVHSRIHPDDMMLISHILSLRFRDASSPAQYSFRLCDPDGTVRWVQCTARTIPWDNGTATLSQFTDITKLKTTAEALEERENTIRSMFEQSPFALAILSVKGIPETTSIAWHTLQQKLSGSVSPSYTIFDDPLVVSAGLTQEVRAALAGEAFSTRALPFLLPAEAPAADSTCWLKLRIYPIRDAAGTLTHVVSIHQDVSREATAEASKQRLLADLSQANADLDAMRTHLDSVIEAIPLAIITVDEQLRITHWNSRMLAMFNISPENIAGRQLTELPPFLAQHAAMLRSSIELSMPQPPARVEDIVDGSPKHHEASAFPLEVPARGAVLCIEDLTAKIAVEQGMLHSKKLISIGAMAAGIAHEINNPLSIVMQGVQNIQRRLMSDLPANISAAEQAGCSLAAIRKYVEQRQIIRILEGINEASERATSIIRNMLTFCRREEGSHKAAQLPMLIDKAIELVSADFNLQRNFDFKHITILRDDEPNLPAVLCSPSEIEQVLLNLLKNAAEALHTRRIDSGYSRQIRITTRRDAAAVRLEVADNGPGMTPDQQRRAFEPFYTSKEAGKGTGLGLAICHFIVATKHQGSIRVTDAPEGGAGFSIRLPIATGPHAS